MPDNGAGVFARVYSWVTDKANGLKITASRVDGEFDGMATALTNRICRDGQTTVTARIPFAAGLSVPSGSAGTPAISGVADPNTGLYMPGADAVALSAGGADVISGNLDPSVVSPTSTTTVSAGGVPAFQAVQMGGASPVSSAIISAGGLPAFRAINTNGTLVATVGEDSGLIWTNDNALGVLSTPGYQRFPNGLVLQWGNSVISLDGFGQGVIGFPTPFSTALFSAVAINGDSNSSATAVVAIISGSTSVNGLGIKASGGTGSFRVNWLAVGH